MDHRVEKRDLLSDPGRSVFCVDSVSVTSHFIVRY